MSLTDAARLVGWEGSAVAVRRRLLRYLRSREEQAECEILTRVGSAWRVTESAMRVHCPELFPVQTEAQSLVADALEDTARRLAEVEDEVSDLRADVATMRIAMKRMVEHARDRGRP